MLLRIEVAAFHPAAPRPVAGSRGTEVAVPVHAMGMPAPQTRLCGPVPRSAAAMAAARRAAVSRYPALWSPDLPRCRIRHRDCPTCPAPALYRKSPVAGRAERGGPEVRHRSVGKRLIRDRVSRNRRSMCRSLRLPCRLQNERREWGASWRRVGYRTGRRYPVLGRAGRTRSGDGSGARFEC